MIKMPLNRNRNRKQGKIKGTTSWETDSFDVKYESNTFVLFSQGSWSCSGWVEKHNPPPKKKNRTKRVGFKPPGVRPEFKRWVNKLSWEDVSIRDKEQRGCYHPSIHKRTLPADWGRRTEIVGGIRLLLSLIVTGV